MTRYLITKRTLQVAAVLVGLEGGFLVYLGVLLLFPFPSIRDGFGAVLALLFPVLVFLLGGIFLMVAYKALRYFSPGAIRYLLVILALMFYSLIMYALDPLRRILDERKDPNLLQQVVIFLPLIAAWLSYKITTAMVTVGLRREETGTGESKQASVTGRRGAYD
jgi:hypothetical protein